MLSDVDVLAGFRAITAWTTSNIIAGLDSTAVVMSTVLFNLLTHRLSMHHLLEELDKAERDHGLSRPFPSWNELCNLPFLDACIKEATRIHPPFSLPLERVAPEGGLTICGRSFEPGTVIGMNPYVVNRHEATFGNSPNNWQPERWLGLDEDEYRKLEQSLLTVSVLGIKIRAGQATLAWLNDADECNSSALAGVVVWERTLLCSS